MLIDRGVSIAITLAHTGQNILMCFPQRSRKVFGSAINGETQDARFHFDPIMCVCRMS